MKTRLKFLTYGLFALALTITSCEKEGVQGPIGPSGPQGEQGVAGPAGPAGEDGEALGVPGPQGPAGADGVDGADGADGTNGADGSDGANGTNGTNGADGNANVIASTWTALNFPTNWDTNDEASFDISDASITQEVVDSYALLSYIQFTNFSSGASSVPFVSLGKQYEIHDSMRIGQFTAFAIVNDKIARPNPPTNHRIRYVLIAPSGSSGKGDAPSLEKMKKDGIDTNNYKDVMDYLGLDY